MAITATKRTSELIFFYQRFPKGFTFDLLIPKLLSVYETLFSETFLLRSVNVLQQSQSQVILLSQRFYASNSVYKTMCGTLFKQALSYQNFCVRNMTAKV